MAIFMYIYTPHLQAWNLQIFSPFEGVKLYLLHKFMSIKKDGKNHVYCRFVHPTANVKFLINFFSHDYFNFYLFSFRPEHFFCTVMSSNPAFLEVGNAQSIGTSKKGGGGLSVWSCRKPMTLNKKAKLHQSPYLR